MSKKIFFVLFLTITIVACNNTKKTNEADNNDKNIEIESKSGTIELTKAGFLAKIANYEENPNEWKYLGDKPAIIDFYATWCGPCKVVAPIFEKLAKEYDGQIYIYKIDVDKEKELAAAFGIQSIPSVLFIPVNGSPQMMQGALPEESYKEAINQILLGNDLVQKN